MTGTISGVTCPARTCLAPAIRGRIRLMPVTPPGRPVRDSALGQKTLLCCLVRRLHRGAARAPTPRAHRAASPPRASGAAGPPRCASASRERQGKPYYFSTKVVVQRRLEIAPEVIGPARRTNFRHPRCEEMLAPVRRRGRGRAAAGKARRGQRRSLRWRRTGRAAVQGQPWPPRC